MSWLKCEECGTRWWDHRLPSDCKKKRQERLQRDADEQIREAQKTRATMVAETLKKQEAEMLKLQEAERQAWNDAQRSWFVTGSISLDEATRKNFWSSVDNRTFKIDVGDASPDEIEDILKRAQELLK